MSEERSAPAAIAELKAMATATETAYSALEPLTVNGRRQALGYLIKALEISDLSLTPSPQNSVNATGSDPANEQPHASAQVPSPKEFINTKRPQTVAERVACHAFYLTHYRDTPSFGAAEIAALNTEAAARGINPKRDLDNADRGSGYLVSAGDRKKQITTRGEELVKALPDRDKVSEALAQFPHKRRVSSSKKRSQADGDAE